MPPTVVARVWLQFAQDCATAQSRQQLHEAFTHAMNQLGFDRVNVSLMRDFDMPESEIGFGFVNTYPGDWQHYYLDKQCMRYDPVALCAKGYVSPFFWKDINRLIVLSPTQTRFLKLAEEAGLYNGIGLPFMGPHSIAGGVALATSSKNDEHLQDLNMLWSFSSLLYLRWREIALKNRPHPLLHASLTDREIDILRLSTGGKSDREVGRALMITENTVNTHLRNIYRKLDARSRLQAFASAIRLGIINPT